MEVDDDSEAQVGQKKDETIKKPSRSSNNSVKKFAYFHRMSYTCTLKLFKMIYT
jgi:hypothetical protein